MQNLKYGFRRTLKGVGFEQAKTQTVEALAREGFGILTEIDVKATLKKKLELDFRPYTILGACNPALAHRAISLDPQIGLLLPCNVVLQEGPEEGSTDVSFVNPRAMFSMVDDARIEPIVNEAYQRLRRALEALSGSAS